MVKRAEEPGLAAVEAFVVKAVTASHDVYVGIDPGADGAIAFLCGNLYCVISMPVIEVARTRRVKLSPKERVQFTNKTKVVHGKTKKFNLTEIVAVFKALRPVRQRVFACVEIASPMVGGNGGQNVRTAFMVGVGYGMWSLFLLSKGYAVNEIEPEAWKKEFGLLRKDKNASLQKARGLWPRAPLTRNKDHGRAESLLLAESFRRHRGQA